MKDTNHTVEAALSASPYIHNFMPKVLIQLDFCPTVDRQT